MSLRAAAIAPEMPPVGLEIDRGGERKEDGGGSRNCQPAAVVFEDDDEDSDPYESGSDSEDSASSQGGGFVVDPRHEERKRKRQLKKEHLENKKTGERKKAVDFTKARNALKERVIEEVMREVLPDIGQYDVNTAEPPTGKNWYDPCVRLGKFLGLLNLDIHEAVLSGSEYQVESTLEKLHAGKKSNRALINMYDKRGCTALSYAVKTDQQAMAFSIVNHKIDTNVPDVDTGRSPLFFAGRQGNYELVKILLAAGANPSYSDYQNVTPFMMAASKGDHRSLSAMLAQKTYFLEVDMQDSNGWTALHYSVYGNAPKACRVLCDAGCDKGLLDRNRRSPLHLAKYLDYGDCISALEDGKVKLADDT